MAPEQLTQNDFDFDTSSMFDLVEGEIIDAKFLRNPDYEAKVAESGGKSTPQLYCWVKSPEHEEPVKIGGWSIGGSKAWEIAGDEMSVTDPKGKNNFHHASNAGIFAAEIIKLMGSGDPKKGTEIASKRGIRMNDARFYIGLSSIWVRKTMKHPVEDNKEIKVMVPTNYLKISGKSTTTAAAVPKKQAVAPIPVKVTGVSGNPEATLELVLSLVNGKRTEGEIKSFVMATSELRANKDLLNGIFKENILTVLIETGQIIKGDDGKLSLPA